MTKWRNAAAAASCAKFSPIGCGVVALQVLAGCASVTPPDRLYSIETEMSAVATSVSPDELSVATKKQRNEIITKRKYAIDLNYTKYELALTHEAQLVDFSEKAANVALTSTALLVPVSQTKDLLNGIGTGLNSLDDAYNEKILRAQLVQDIQASMRTGRHDQAAVIFANMDCSIRTYTMAMALSDIEAYYRAGTFRAGVAKLNQTVADAEHDSKANAEAQKSGNSDAQAALGAKATEASMKAVAATRTRKAPCKVTAASD